MNKTSMLHMIASAAITVGLCCGIMSLSSCSRPGSQNPGSSASNTASAPKTGSKLASSLKAYAQSMLDGDKQSSQMGEEQKAIIERAAKGDGTVSRADYEQAWANYRKCIVDRGWTDPTLKHLDGLYAAPPIDVEGLSDAQQHKLDEDLQYCSITYVTDLDQLYRTQVANPGLSSANYQLIVDCLKKNGVVGKDYTSDKLQDDLGDKLDLSDSAVQTCLVKYGYSANDARDESTYWKPLG